MRGNRRVECTLTLSEWVSTNVWVGFTKDGPDEPWHWTDGTPVYFSEDINLDGTFNENCARLTPRLIDNPCSHFYWYMCEYQLNAGMLNTMLCLLYNY